MYDWKWAEEFFIKKADLFLRLMNAMWKNAPTMSAALINVLEKFDVLPGAGRILDLMCGNGRIALYLAEKGYEVVGIDFSPKFIEDAKRRAKLMGVEDKVTFVLGDIRKLKEHVEELGPFDAVINVWTSLGYYGKEVDKIMFRQAREVAREGGIFIIADTASKEYVLTGFSQRTYVESEDTLILHFADYDPVEGVLTDIWRFYEKSGDILRFLGAAKVCVKLYSISEVREMLEECGWKVVAAYDSIFTLKPARWDSPINIVAKAVSEKLADEID